MSQNLNSLLGTSGAAAFLALAASTRRYPTLSLETLHPDGTQAADISCVLKSFRLEFSDDFAAAKATFVLDNAQAYFDRYGTKGGAGLLAENTLVRFRKGLQDPATGTRYLIPAFYGRIAVVAPNYERDVADTLEMTCLDLLKNPLRAKYTTDAYQNTEVNLIAADVAARYMGIPAARQALFPVSYVYPFVQFPDLSPVDMLAWLFGPLIFSVRVDEGGGLVTAPRLGSPHSVTPNLKGFPDATSAPPDSALAHTFPDGSLIRTYGERWGDLGFSNCVRTTGQARAATVTLGPSQILYSMGDSTLDSVTKTTRKFPFAQGGGGNNAVSAQGVQVVFRYSTEHALDSAPRFVVLAGDPGQPFPPGAGVPVGTPVKGVNQGFGIYNADPRDVGFVMLKALTPTFAVLEIDGDQFTGGSGERHGGFDYAFDIWGQPQESNTATLTAYADYGAVAVAAEDMPAYGTAFGAGVVPTGDLFGDHKTYQLGHQPLAYSVPVAVQVNPSTMPQTTLSAAAAAGDRSVSLFSLSDVSGAAGDLTLAVGAGATLEYVRPDFGTWTSGADPLPLLNPLRFDHASGEDVLGYTGVQAADGTAYTNQFKVDYERGRVVLQNLSYLDFTEDDDAAHPLSATLVPLSDGSGSEAGDASHAIVPSAANAEGATVAFDLSGLDVPAPLALYQTRRVGDTVYTLGGLTLGQGYDLRLHFADPQAPYSPANTGGARAGTTVFSVFVNDAEEIADLDLCVQTGGSRRAYQATVSGAAPVPAHAGDATGVITVVVTQHDPVTGQLLEGSRADDWTEANGHRRGEAQVCGVEVLSAAGQGAQPYAINAGGPALSPTPPLVRVSYGYSPVQAEYGVQVQDDDNPLLATQGQCQDSADFKLNYAAWGRNPLTVKYASVPHLQPGDLVKYYHQPVNADVWAYLQKITRAGQRPPGGPVAVGVDADTDVADGFVLFVQPRA